MSFCMLTSHLHSFSFLKTLNTKFLNFFFLEVPSRSPLSSKHIINNLSSLSILLIVSPNVLREYRTHPGGAFRTTTFRRPRETKKEEKKRPRNNNNIIMSYSRLTNDGGLSPLREDISTQANRVQSLIFQLQTNVSTFKRLVDQLGTAEIRKQNETAQIKRVNRPNAKESSVLVKKLAKMVTDLVHEEQDHEYDYEGGEDEDDAESLAERHKKLVKDLHATLKDFQRAQRACAERESTFLPQKENVESPKQAKSGKKKGYGATGGNNNGADVALSGERGGQFYQASQMVDEEQQHAPLLMEHKSQGQKEMTAVEIDMRFNDQLIEERERGIAEIQQQIGEVNEIFQDLAVLVNEQGNMIDDIEANIVSTAVRTKEAQKELTKADKSQSAEIDGVFSNHRLYRAHYLDSVFVAVSYFYVCL